MTTTENNNANNAGKPLKNFQLTITDHSGNNTRGQRRKSSILPAFLRRKSERKDSVFNSESTTTLWPHDTPPSFDTYQSSSEGEFKFGWVNGVYVRTVLNIWGVMLFLRMGWITGEAGIVVALAIIIGSTIVTLFTALSMSAICTNGEVGGGGIYYMISRSLGAEAGSMIGIIFSFANAVLVSLNLVGAAETISDILADNGASIFDKENEARLFGALLLTLVAIIPFVGMEWEAKAQFFLLVILLCALLNYVIGTLLPESETKNKEGLVGWKSWVIEENLWPKWKDGNFFSVFGVFFPSVIGIFAGASMSGDLRDPNAAIPKGTFLAITTTSLTYAILTLFLGATLMPFANGNETISEDNYQQIIDECMKTDDCTHGLITDYQTMTMTSAFGPLIYAGIFAATISSALGSYVCAPRIFQALCEDNLFPYIKFFAKGYGAINDPRRGYILTYGISLVFIAIGNLNAIAPLISNFFLASFFLVNITCFHASFVESPSFRPSFKYYNKWISLLTALACIVIEFLLDYISAIITNIIMLAILLYISKKGPDVNWGSSKRAQVHNAALSSTLKLISMGEHVKNFRPSILLLTGNPTARVPLVDFANTITKNKSLLLIGHIVNIHISTKMRSRAIAEQYKWFAKRRVKGFYLLHESDSISSGAKNMIQISGLGRLKANILMLGYKSSWQECVTKDLLDYYNVILVGIEYNMAVIILRIQEGLDYADFFESRKNSTIFSKPFLPVLEEPKEEEEETPTSLTVQSDKAVNDVTSNATQIKNYKTFINQIKTLGLIPNDAIEAMNQFNQKQPKGNIDIWWLTDDGGLTMLIPYILSINEMWRECKLRIFSIIKNKQEIEKEQENLTNIIKKWRIPHSEIMVLAESDEEATEQTKQKYKQIISKWMTKDDVDSPLTISKNELLKGQEITNNSLKLRDLLYTHSLESTLVVMTLPLPNKEIPAPLYMSWLEILTEGMPPFLFIRGNGTSVLTFYS